MTILLFQASFTLLLASVITAHPLTTGSDSSASTSSLEPTILNTTANAVLYSCTDRNLQILESAKGPEPGGLAQYQYNTIRNLANRFDEIARDIPTADFNAEISVSTPGQGRASMKNAPGASWMPAPEKISVRQASGCVQALADSVREQAMSELRMQDREWFVVPRQGPKMILAKGEYKAATRDGNDVAQVDVA